MLKSPTFQLLTLWTQWEPSSTEPQQLCLPSPNRFFYFIGCGAYWWENLKMLDKIKFKFVDINFLNRVISQLLNYELACSPVFTVLDWSHTEQDYKQQSASELGRHCAMDCVIIPISGSIVTSFLSTLVSNQLARERMGLRALSVKINEADGSCMLVFGIDSIFTKNSWYLGEASMSMGITWVWGAVLISESMPCGLVFWMHPSLWWLKPSLLTAEGKYNATLFWGPYFGIGSYLMHFWWLEGIFPALISCRNVAKDWPSGIEIYSIRHWCPRFHQMKVATTSHLRVGRQQPKGRGSLTERWYLR